MDSKSLNIKTEPVSDDPEQTYLKDFPSNADDENSGNQFTTNKQYIVPNTDVAYDADVDDEIIENKHALNIPLTSPYHPVDLDKIQSERNHIYEIFHPWALKTYGDQAKTKTITLRKKVRILKALEGKEHSLPDSSKFRFWVKSKGFTTKRPDEFSIKNEGLSSNTQLPPDAVLSDNPNIVDLYVLSRNKENGKKLYRKVAVVEEFFDIIHNVHMALGGRSGMHAGQKRTYRIITETYAFLPREAVTKFLSTCPECKKNLRPSSPGSFKADPANESSSELESSHTESSLEAGPTLKRKQQQNMTNTNLPTSTPKRISLEIPQTSSSYLKSLQIPNPPMSLIEPHVPPQVLLPALDTSRDALSFDTTLFKSHSNLLRYYDFMRRFYLSNIASPSAASNTLTQMLSGNAIKDLTLKRSSDTILTSPSTKKLRTSNTTTPFNSLAKVDELSQTDTNLTNIALNLTKDVTSRSPERRSESKKQLTTKDEDKDESHSKTLPPLDWERLKPITSTYLQLTRSMGLSDEDALRFDNLVSDDFKYTL